MRDELEDLLQTDPIELAALQKRRYDELVGDAGRPIVLFGAGALGRRTLEGLRRAGREPEAFLDNNPALWGTRVDRVEVLSPAQAVERHGGAAAFVLATYNTAKARAQLASLACPFVVSYAHLFARYPDAMLPHACLAVPGPIFQQAELVRQAFGLFDDDEQRRLFIAQLRWRMFLDFDTVRFPQTEALRDGEYFPADLYDFRPDEVLLDCGAFDGDTVRRFLARRGEAFKAVVAMEPDPSNRQRFEAWRRSLPGALGDRITSHQAAVGAARGKERFRATGTAGSLVGPAGSIEVDVVSVDEVMASDPPTLIKMDVEGAELNALQGARRLIASARPVLAVTVYHEVDHLWRIPIQIRSYVEDYRFFLRAHAEDCWDVSCYAVPVERLAGSRR